MNQRIARYIGLLACLSIALSTGVSAAAAVGAGGEPEELYCTAGTWPDAPMRSGLHTTSLELDDARWSADFSTRDLIFRLFAVVGASKPTAKSFVTYDDQCLKLGGQSPHESASVIWKFQAPQDNAFSGGTVSVVATITSTSGKIDRDALFAAVGTDLQLTGGGEYLRPFSGYKRESFAIAPFDSARIDQQQQVRIPIPKGSRTFYVAVTRDAMNSGASATLVVHSVAVEPQFRDSRGMTIRFDDRADPLWSAGEPIQLRVNATGQPAPATVEWTLRRDGEKKPQLSGSAPVAGDGSATIDLSNAQAGFYTLAVGDKVNGKPLDSQQLVILRAQDPTITHENSIFGGFEAIGDAELARRMGVKWDVMVRHWSSAQRTPDAVPEFSMNDSAATARGNGFEPIVLIDTAPPWANGGKEEIVPPLDTFYDEWQAFNEAVARAYAGKVTWYQSWNEPNNPSAFKFDGSQAESRVKAKQVQRYQYKGLKAGDAEAKLIGGCFAGIPAGEFAEWLREPFGVLQFQDAMSGHSYCRALPEENYKHKYPPEPTLVPEILAARQAMDDNGAGDQPLFWTEYGWQHEQVNDDEKQARWQARHMIIMQAYRQRTRTLADCVFSFNPDSGYGIVRHPRTLKPGEHRFRRAVGAYATVASLLAGSEALDPISDYPNEVYAYRFRKGDQTIIAAWATEQARTRQVRIPIRGEQNVTRVGLLGEQVDETIDFSKPLALPKNGDPVYLLMNEGMADDRQ